MSGWLFVHIFALGIWLGCVIIEGILETAGHHDEALRATVARIHFRIDLLAEIPAFTLVAISGIAMLQPERMHGDYALMVIAGSVAIAVNALCVLPVARRRQLANRTGTEIARQELQAHTRRIYLAGVVGLPFAAAALYGGLRITAG